MPLAATSPGLRGGRRPARGRAAAVLVSAWLATVARAQEAPTPLSLEEAVLVALDRSETVEQAEAGVARAEGQLVQALSGFLPQVTGTVTYQRTFVSEYDAAFSSDEATDEAEADTDAADTDAPAGAGGGAAGASGGLPFGRDHLWRADVRLDQSLYAGGANVAQVRIARAVERANRIGIDEAKAQTVLATATAYLDAQLQARLLRVAEDAVGQALDAAEAAELRYRLGVAPELDVEEARVTVGELQVEVVRARHAHQHALLQLRQLLELPLDVPLRLTTALPLDPPGTPIDDPNGLAGLPAAPDRAPVRQADEAIRQAQGTVGVARAQGLPRVSLTADAYVAAYPEDPLPPLDPDAWRPNVTTTLVAQIPIFTGLRVRGAVQVARADVASAVARRDQTREQAELEAAQVRQDVLFARETLAAAADAERAATRAYEMAALRASEGMLARLELDAARVRAARASGSVAQAARDLALAELRCLLLPNLPLQSVSPTAITTAGAPGAGATGVSAPTATSSTGTTGGVSAPTATTTTGTAPGSATPTPSNLPGSVGTSPSPGMPGRTTP